MKRKFEENERFFSVELKSGVNLKNVTLTNEGQQNVLIEGSIGELQRAEFSEGIILEIVGDKGVLRINLSLNEINKKKSRKKRRRKCRTINIKTEEQKQATSRLVSMDFVRVLALFGVILFHASGAYANIPYWSVQNGTSNIAIGIRELVDVFIMPLFFFLAGYFTLSSLRKKGSWGFLKSKFWELGFAWIVIVILVIPFSWWIVNRHTATGGYLTTWFTWIQSIGQTRLGVFETPAQSVHLHFWFISLLFAFFIAFLLIYKIVGNNFAFKHFSVTETATSREKALAILAFGVICAVGYFVSLLLVPDASWLTINLFLEFQPSKLFIFAACFGLGIYAYSKNWFTNGKQIGKLSLWAPATILLSAAFLIVGQDVFQNPMTTTALSPAYLLLYAAVTLVPSALHHDYSLLAWRSIL